MASYRLSDRSILACSMWAASLILAGSLGAASGPLHSTASVAAAGRGGPWIHLEDGRKVVASFQAVDGSDVVLASGSARPLTLTAGDFDEDGVPDLLGAYESDGRGILVVWPGNVDSLYPHTPEARARHAAGAGADELFLRNARSTFVPTAPELAGVGDFDGDGHLDVVLAGRLESSLHLLAGDGHGRFAAPRTLELPGPVTTLVSGEIDRPDGLADLAVAVESREGPFVLVFESPDGAWNSEPVRLGLPAPATALVLGRWPRGEPSRAVDAASGSGHNGARPNREDGRSRLSWDLEGGAVTVDVGDQAGAIRDHFMDLIVAAGRSLLVFEGRDRKLALDSERRAHVKGPVVRQHSLPFEARSLALGDFEGTGRTELALLAGDGTLHTFRSAGDELEERLVVDLPPAVTRLVPARLASRPGVALVAPAASLHVLAGGSEPLAASIPVQGGAVAVLPMQLNDDAIDDLVVLRSDGIEPLVTLSTPESTFVVTTAANSGAGTLRDAITQANATPGADVINFTIPGTGVKTITLTSPLPTLTEAVTIDGTTQTGYSTTPLVQLNGASAGAGASGLTIAAPNCTVRGLAIVAFSDNGILIQGAGATGNSVRSCHIGVVASGATASGNLDDGIEISNGAQATIGGTVAAARNVISGNRVDGIFIDGLGGSANNQIQGNHIGVNFAGTGALPNGSGATLYHGIEIARLTTGNVVGGSVAGARNVISGNAGLGVGIFNGGTSSNLVQGNYIGTTANGLSALSNGAGGAAIMNPGGPAQGPEDNLIGGTIVVTRNVISGNSSSALNPAGVLIFDSGTRDNLVQGNYIGIDANGTAALVNYDDGVNVNAGATATTVGGTAAGARNVIVSRNTTDGVFVGASGNFVQGNYVGLDAGGTVGFNRGSCGIGVVSNAVIGGTDPGAGNVVASQQVGGICVSGTQNRIEGNLVGTDATGTLARGNGFYGIDLFGGAQANTISQNLVSGNRHGIYMTDANTSGNVVQGNLIGTKIDGVSPLGNTQNGVLIQSSANGNSIGGTIPGAENTIAFNGGAGVFVETGSANGIRHNRIFSNSALGIDLAPNGVNANDACDADSGPNDLQNAPVVTAAVDTGSLTGIQGTLDSTASTTFTLELYASSSCDPSGSGEGETYLGSTTVSTDGSCGAAFNVVLPFSVPAGQGLTMTASAPGGPTGTTSEFSNCVVISSGCIVPLEVTNLRAGDKTTLTWDSALAAGPGTVHDVVQGLGTQLPVGSGAGETCVGTTAGTMMTVPDIPAPQQWLWYLVRGRNSCGAGSYGSRSNGSPRVTTACP